jgi:KR domain
LIGNQTAVTFKAVMAGKSAGVLHLIDKLSVLPLILTCMFSSISSVVAPKSQPNYAAANSVLNAASNLQNSQVSVLAEICVNVGPWLTKPH